MKRRKSSLIRFQFPFIDGDGNFIDLKEEEFKKPITSDYMKAVYEHLILQESSILTQYHALLKARYESLDALGGGTSQMLIAFVAGVCSSAVSILLAQSQNKSIAYGFSTGILILIILALFITSIIPYIISNSKKKTKIAFIVAMVEDILEQREKS